MLTINIRGGNGTDLCRTCRFCETRNTARYCCGTFGGREGPSIIKERVFECSCYGDKRLPHLYDLKQTAWVLVQNKVTRELGFVNNREFKARYEKEEGDL